MAHADQQPAADVDTNDQIGLFGQIGFFVSNFGSQLIIIAFALATSSLGFSWGVPLTISLSAVYLLLAIGLILFFGRIPNQTGGSYSLVAIGGMFLIAINGLAVEVQPWLLSTKIDTAPIYAIAIAALDVFAVIFIALMFSPRSDSPLNKLQEWPSGNVVKLPDWVILVSSLLSTVLVVGCYMYSFLVPAFGTEIGNLLYKARVVLVVAATILIFLKAAINVGSKAERLLIWVAGERDKLIRMSSDWPKTAASHKASLGVLYPLVSFTLYVFQVVWLFSTWTLYVLSWCVIFFGTTLINFVELILRALASDALWCSILISLGIICAVSLVTSLSGFGLSLLREVDDVSGDWGWVASVMLGWTLVVSVVALHVLSSDMALRPMWNAIKLYMSFFLVSMWLLVLFLHVAGSWGLSLLANFPFRVELSLWNAGLLLSCAMLGVWFVYLRRGAQEVR